MRAVFVVGKGGVGKTTCAAAMAVALSERLDTLIVSLDPAHNLGDVLGTPLSGRATQVAERLQALEVDLERATRDYLEESARRLKESYGYLKALNLEGYLDTLRLSPGIEEYATLEAMADILEEHQDQDVVVFDTPPTGLTLRVLALPRVSLIWAGKLVGLRKQILGGRRTLDKVSGQVRRFVLEGQEFELPSSAEKDSVMQELLRYTEEVQGLRDLQTDRGRSMVMPVMNADRLSLFETKRALSVLDELSMSVGPVVVNKYAERKPEQEVLKAIGTELRKPVRTVPVLQEEPLGVDSLKIFARFLNPHDWLPTSSTG
jgi:arsenite-transporting ATPase